MLKWDAPVSDETYKIQKKRKHKLFIYDFLDIDEEYFEKTPKISYSVRCTDKGWGIEITELIRKCLSGFIKVSLVPNFNLRLIIIDNFILVEGVYISLFILFVLNLAYRALEVGFLPCQNLSDQLVQYVKIGISIDKKVDFLIQLFDACNNQKYSPSLMSFVVPFVLLILGFLTLPLIYKLIDLPRFRFLLFTRESKIVRDNYHRKLADRKTFWIVVVLSGVIIGLLVNYIFAFLTSTMH